MAARTVALRRADSWGLKDHPLILQGRSLGLALSSPGCTPSLTWKPLPGPDPQPPAWPSPGKGSFPPHCSPKITATNIGSAGHFTRPVEVLDITPLYRSGNRGPREKTQAPRETGSRTVGDTTPALPTPYVPSSLRRTAGARGRVRRRGWDRDSWSQRFLTSLQWAGSPLTQMENLKLTEGQEVAKGDRAGTGTSDPDPYARVLSFTSSGT